MVSKITKLLVLVLVLLSYLPLVTQARQLMNSQTLPSTKLANSKPKSGTNPI